MMEGAPPAQTGIVSPALRELSAKGQLASAWACTPSKEGLEAAKIQPNKRYPKGFCCHMPQNSQARYNGRVAWGGFIQN